MKTRIMLVDDNYEFIAEASKFFSSKENYELCGTADNGAKALELFAAEPKPDVIVLDLVMPVLDGFSVLERINKQNTKIVVLSALSQDAFITKAMSLGADYYMMKPVTLTNLAERIEEILHATPKETSAIKRPAAPIRNRSLEEKISNIFITVGIPAHIKGYQFLREAIKMAIDSPDIINSITKRLYPEVANRFDTSPSKVERAIRHAIEVAWNRGKIENINSLFGVRVYNHNEKPTNGEFIALVADKMLLESV